MSQLDLGADDRPRGLPRSGSASRLNAQAPEFVPRAAPPPPAPTVVRIFPRPPPPPAAFFVAGPAPPPPPPPFDYYAAAPVRPGGGGFGAAAAEQEAEAELTARDGIFDDVVHKVQKQVGGCSSLHCCCDCAAWYHRHR
jgi:La-related protein 7